MDDLEFNSRFNNALSRLRSGGTATVQEEQERLRALLPEIETERDRQWAAKLIDDLPRAATPPKRSKLYAEALELQASAFHYQGTVEDRIAVLDDACKRIYQMADQTTGDEQAGIRGLTRMLEHLQQRLIDPPFPLDDENQ